MDAVFIVIGIGIITAVYLLGKRHVSSKKGEIDDILGKQSGFQASQKLISMYGDFCLAIDEENRKICLISKSTDTGIKVLNFQDLVSSEILEDDTELMKKSRVDETGIVDGGLSEKTKAVRKVSSIKLRLVVSDKENPIHLIEFLYQKSNRRSVRYRQAIGSATQWHAVISELLKRADAETRAQDVSA